MSEDTYEGSDLEALADLPNYQSWFLEIFKPSLRGRMVEYGAGAGTISAKLLPLADKLDLIEPSPNLLKRLRDRFKGEKKVTVQGRTLEDHVAGVETGTYDTVVLINVLEHVEKDGEAVRELLRILKPGGHLCLFVPALRQLYSELDRLVGHYRRYHEPDFKALVEGAGGEVLLSRYFDILGVAPWWLLNKVMGKTDFDPRMTKLYDTVGVPVTKAFESLIKPPFGKNVILVVRKP